MSRLHLVRHARSLADPSTPPDTWPLDPGGYPELAAFAASPRLPAGAPWYSSPEVKALDTARRLTGRPVTVVEELAEHRRGVHWFADPEDFRDAVHRAFTEPEKPSVPEWEPLAATRERLVPAVRRILDGHAPDDDVVLVGHGTAWTLLVAELTGRAPDLEAWAVLRMPDLWVVDGG